MKNYYYYSEMGCVKIGNENFNLMLLNDKGEGSFWIHICNKKENQKMNECEFITKISGTDINLYESDNSNSRILKLDNGNYLVFSSKGNIILEKE